MLFRSYVPSITGTTQQLVSKGSSGSGNGWYVAVLSSGVLEFGRPNAPVATGTTIPTSAWFHFAASRLGTTTRLYLNGVQVASASDSANYSDSTPTYVGVFGDGSSQPLTGYIQDLRLTKGYARYVQPFTPPTTADQLY